MRRYKKSGRCFWCDEKSVDLTRDHIIPRAANGPDDTNNIVAACFRCNGERGRLVSESIAIAKAKEGLLSLRAICRMRRRAEEIKDLQSKWIKLEMSLLGRSPTAEFDLVAPSKKIALAASKKKSLPLWQGWW